MNWETIPQLGANNRKSTITSIFETKKCFANSKHRVLARQWGSRSLKLVIKQPWAAIIVTNFHPTSDSPDNNSHTCIRRWDPL